MYSSREVQNINGLSMERNICATQKNYFLKHKNY